MSGPLVRILFVSISVLSATARAELGAHINSFALPPETKQCQSTNKGNYTFKECTLNNGITMRVYATTSGIAFGVVWEGGRHHLDFNSILGSKVEDYRKKDAETKHPLRGGGVKTVDTGDIKVETGGRFGKVNGRAWVPKLIPEGLTSDDIK